MTTLQPQVLLLLQQVVWTNGMQLFVQLPQPPPLLDPPELLPPPELLVEPPLLELDPMQTPLLQVSPVCVQSVQPTPPVPQYGSTWAIWQLPLLSQQPEQVVAQLLASSAAGAS